MKKKIIVSALTLIAGFGLLGSVTSTIAWYQYSTKATAAYLGVAGGSKGNLQMRFKADNQAADAGWTTKITKEQMATYLGQKNIVPVTSGAKEKHDSAPSKLYCNPIYGYAAQSSWKEATADNYVKIELELRYHQANDSGESNLAKDIYLSDLFIAQDAADAQAHGDLSSAIRFHVAAYTDPAAKTNRLISKNGETIATCGNLDLNGDTKPDRTYDNQSDKYGFTDGEGTLINYGYDQNTENTQVSYSSSKTGTNSIVADLATNNKEGKKLGSTLEANDAFLNIDIVIWVEGWQPLPENSNNPSAIWDAATFINAQFDVGFEFEADL